MVECYNLLIELFFYLIVKDVRVNYKTFAKRETYIWLNLEIWDILNKAYL